MRCRKRNHAREQIDKQAKGRRISQTKAIPYLASQKVRMEAPPAPCPRWLSWLSTKTRALSEGTKPQPSPQFLAKNTKTWSYPGASSISQISPSIFTLTLSRPSFLHSTCGSLSPVSHRIWILSLGHSQSSRCLWSALHPSQLPGTGKTGHSFLLKKPNNYNALPRHCLEPEKLLEVRILSA